MRRIYQAAAIVFLLVSIFVVFQASSMNYLTPLGPGAGFFLIWLGLVLGGLSLAWLVQVSVRPVEDMAPDFVPDRAGLLRILVIIVALVLYTALVDSIGYQVTTFVFLLVLLRTLGRQRFPATLAVSILGSFGVYYVFSNWLGVLLPQANIDWLGYVGF